MFVCTGKYYNYELEVDSAQEALQNLRRTHDEIMDAAENRLETECSKDVESKLAMILDDCWFNVDAISEAVQPLDEERKAVVYTLFQQRMIDAFEIAQAASSEKLNVRRSTNGGVRPAVDAAIEKALDVELSRCGPSGPVNLARVAENLRNEGINRGWQSLYRRLQDRGVALKTTGKIRCRPDRDSRMDADNRP